MTVRHLPPTREQEDAIVRTVTYASLFDYPLTPAELASGLVRTVATEEAVRAWLATSARLRAVVEEVDGYYVPRGRGDLVRTRHRREAASRRLLGAHARALRSLAGLPFVRMTALSGTLAHLNAARGADVDLFVVTAPGRVWSVTVTALVIARLRGWRRHLCLNYVVSERSLAVGPEDLFTANQVINLRPLTGVDVYRRFLDANPFVRRFYPNFVEKAPWPLEPPIRWPRARRLTERVLDGLGLAALYERVCRAAYSWHLQRQASGWRSRDQVRLDDECLKLHTSSHRADVMARFEAAVSAVLGEDGQEMERRRAGAGGPLGVL